MKVLRVDQQSHQFFSSTFSIEDSKRDLNEGSKKRQYQVPGRG